MKFSTAVLAVSLGLPWAPPARAHIELMAPTPRVPDVDNIKQTPCGPGMRNSSRVSTFRPGETITLEWEETVPHPGYYRVLLDEDGQNDLPKPSMTSFQLHHDYYNGNGVTMNDLPAVVQAPTKQGNTWVLADYWGQHRSGGKKMWSLQVKLPNITCDNCTLQLLQSMFEKGRTYDNAYYYHCADLVLKGEAMATLGRGRGRAQRCRCAS